MIILQLHVFLICKQEHP